jgi:redox-sensitive bicupin YhaK (pirin superfamily)
MITILHKAETRGHANHGWLDTWHTFSFAEYYDPERMHFGALRVLNDDTVAPGMGFGKHPHDNMEIISIPLSGDLEHGDSIGNEGVIREGDIQVMSAGTGIIHSERNKNRDKAVKFLQIWVFPDKQNVEPRYDQISLKDISKENEFYQILSPNPDDQGVWIHQQAWFYLGNFSGDRDTEFSLNRKENGLYAFVLEGKAIIDKTELGERDGTGIWETDHVHIKAMAGARILLMEVPMESRF